MNDEIQRFYDDVARRIAIARKEHQPSLTQEDLATRTDSLTRSAVANIESFRQRVALHQLLEIAAALSVPPSQLLPALQLVPTSQAALPEDAAARRFLSNVLEPKRPRLSEPETP